MDLKEFIAVGANWRKIIRLNTKRTYFVIFTFIIIYSFIGLLVDLYFAAGHYPHATLSEIFIALITFKIFPFATLILFFIAIFALIITFSWHDKLMLLGTDYREITPETARTTQELQLYNVVEEMKIAAGLKFMPKVYLINADYMNAFASGYSERSAMIAITTGLFSKLNREELQAVMAHELSHIRNMDIKLTLMAAVLTNISLIVIDILFRNMIFGNEGKNGKTRNNLYLIIVLLRIILPTITVLLVLYLSRTREYLADAGCVELMRDNQPLAKALLKIYNDHISHQQEYSKKYNQTPHEFVRREAYIFDPKQAGIANFQSFSDLFSTHPSIKQRLSALGFSKNNDL